MAEKLPIVEEALKRAGKIYIEYLQDELENQSHVASGKLSNGFYVRVHNTSKGLRMDVMNNVSYMYTVNDGASGVTASYSALEAWTNQKVARGELNFSSESRKKYFINKVKSELEKKYLTIYGFSPLLVMQAAHSELLYLFGTYIMPKSELFRVNVMR